ncbi:MAG: hypothetical protein ACR2MX_15290 [Cyclobacteriaceae bacterium]
MNLTKILTVVFFAISLALAAYLVRSVYNDIQWEKTVRIAEDKVIQKLEMIRAAQLAYQAGNGKYTSDWDKLIDYVENGTIYITNRKEIIIPLEYGEDSVIVQIDTLGSVNVKDSLFKSTEYPGFDAKQLAYVPDSDKKFQLWADEINKSGVMVDVVEAVDPDPIDKTRKEDSDFKNRRPLRFGSRTEVTTAGNWE